MLYTRAGKEYADNMAYIEYSQAVIAYGHAHGRDLFTREVSAVYAEHGNMAQIAGIFDRYVRDWGIPRDLLEAHEKRACSTSLQLKAKGPSTGLSEFVPPVQALQEDTEVEMVDEEDPAAFSLRAMQLSIPNLSPKDIEKEKSLIKAGSAKEAQGSGADMSDSGAFFNRLEKWQQGSWWYMRKMFEERFGTPRDGERGCNALQQLKLRENDTAVSFCARFEEAWEWCYPSHKIYPDVFDQLVIDRFVECIGNSEAHVFLAHSNPRSYAEAKRAFQKFMRGNTWVFGKAWIREVAAAQEQASATVDTAARSLGEPQKPTKVKQAPATQTAPEPRKDYAEEVCRELAQFCEMVTQNMAWQAQP